ncbi:MAG: Riboflavin biosynthesis protein RibF [Candidatus Magasanikbacteria bacterium GW2011_GWA2_45_39]|uniref:riboflavin kinase n=2 Tax=Candidatus Magasanikiibacteriota TaxID=1752731 RepID=A0A0G1MZU3_9BACT|nr:MAG: Riboflavin biosynthesis protein RibF [Candidatus Magasanikbacteria bacterium GW2011_GWA2_45_39]KKU13607.1 MAG: Riboflavin biosynthesis protein RibF [Candidatus Magasanikbacteria bacterium GW2011_GWC2_45_8]
MPMDRENDMKQTLSLATRKGKLCCSRQCLFHVTGLVQRGFGEARKIGFPTLNISYTLPRGKVFEAGVYAVEVNFDGCVYQAAACVGADWNTGQTPKFEVYLFDADGGFTWYDKIVEVSVLKRIRDLVRFDDAKDARSHVAQDVEDIKTFFAR